MSIVLFDNIDRKHLYPLNNTCANADLRIGICTAAERWQKLTSEQVFVFTEAYLSPLYDTIPAGIHYWIDAAILPDEALIKAILSLKNDEALISNNTLIAACGSINATDITAEILPDAFTKKIPYGNVKKLLHGWDIFEHNDAMLRADFHMLTAGRKSQPIPSTCQAVNAEHIFIEEGASISYSVINASTGPVYIGKNAVIMEGSLIRGPFAMCSNAIVKMGTKIYGATTLGPCCVGGGEMKNVVLQGYSNKAHDGYLGDAVIGNWCNLGAGTSNSNVKNTGSIVKMWNKVAHDYVEANMKCGVVMGDYSRTAINSSINTGSVIGTCCNIFGEGLLPKYVPDFQWGSKGITKYELEKSFKDIDNWKKMKGRSLSDAEKKVLQYIFETT